MKKKNDKTAMKKQEDEAIAVHDYGDAELGFEGHTSDHYSIPIVYLCQANSPIVAEDDRVTPGSYYDATNEMIWKRDEGLLFVPVMTRHQYSKWVPREDAGGGGGFRGNLDARDPVVVKAIQESTEFGRYRTYEQVGDKTEQLELRETFYVYGLALDENDQTNFIPFMTAFWSTKIKTYRRWMTRLRTFCTKNRVPMMACMSRMKSESQKNAKGAFFVPTITSADPRGMRYSLLEPEDPRFAEAEKFRALIKEGAAEADFSQQHDESQESEEVPF